MMSKERLELMFSRPFGEGGEKKKKGEGGTGKKYDGDVSIKF